MGTSSRPRRLSVAATSSALLFFAVVVASVVLVRENEGRIGDPVAAPVAPGQDPSEAPQAPRAEEPVRKRSSTSVPGAGSRRDPQGPGVVLGETAPVSGYLFSEEGPVAGETVFLSALATHMRYHATSNDEGFFDLGEVGVGSYQLRIRPQGSYEDYIDSSVDVAAPGLDLELELVPVEDTGSLRGHVVTPDGAVASDVTLLLRSRKSLGKVVQVHADRSGWFVLEGLAEGEVILESQGFPRQIARGLKTSGPGVEDEIKVVVDTGVAALDGLVEDENGRPVAGARVQLLWRQRDGDVEYSSARQATTDASGRFRFEGFAAVEHEIRVQQPGYSAALQMVPAGQDHAAVRLSRAG